VMASQISGLDPLHGYLKHGNLVVEMRVPYMELQAHHEKFIERKVEPALPVVVASVSVAPKQEPVVTVPQIEVEQVQGHWFE